MQRTVGSLPDPDPSGQVFRVSRERGDAFVVGNGEVEVVCADYDVAVAVAVQANLSRRGGVLVERADLESLRDFAAAQPKALRR